MPLYISIPSFFDGGLTSIRKAAKDSKCGICKEPHTDPVKTDCNHIFCRKCIEEQITSTSEGTDRINCPDCHERLATLVLSEAEQRIIYIRAARDRLYETPGRLRGNYVEDNIPFNRARDQTELEMTIRDCFTFNDLPEDTFATETDCLFDGRGLNIALIAVGNVVLEAGNASDTPYTNKEERELFRMLGKLYGLMGVRYVGGRWSAQKFIYDMETELRNLMIDAGGKPISNVWYNPRDPRFQDLRFVLRFMRYWTVLAWKANPFDQDDSENAREDGIGEHGCYEQ